MNETGFIVDYGGYSELCSPDIDEIKEIVRRWAKNDKEWMIAKRKNDLAADFDVIIHYCNKDL